MFTSIGKNVITTTTAAFDGQSKPNHITMIGAMPTIGSAETKLPSGSRPRPRKVEAVGDDGDQEAGAAADDVARQHAAHEGLDEILAEHRQRGGKARRGRARRRHQHRRHAEAAHRDLPEIEQEGAEQQRDREVDGAAPRLAARLDGGQPVTTSAAAEPGREHQRPEARAGGAGDGGDRASSASVIAQPSTTPAKPQRER